jgi:thiamine biosynthesis lipoprotein
VSTAEVPRHAAGRATYTWRALGTTAVLCLHEPGARAGDVRRAVQREIDAIDIAASRFRSESELSQLNDRAGGEPVRVSSLLMQAVRLAIRAAVVSDGAVDPTLAESLVAIGYDRDFAELAPVPAGTAFERVTPGTLVPRRAGRWREIRLCDGSSTVQLPAGLRLDLGATAKALAADRAAQAGYLAGTGSGVLVALGGDIATSGPAPEGGWSVRVTDDHRDIDAGAGQTIAIHDGGLATSSVVARRWLHRGGAVHHILDPRTGAPVHPTWRTVSVAAATCAEANIASTASIVLGTDAPEWLAGQGLPARLVALDGAVKVQGGWPQ